jgi:hypothetical protein
MLIIAVLSGVVAVASMGLSLVLAQRIRVLEDRLRSTKQVPDSPQPQLPESAARKPLEGLRIAVNIRQDHTNPIFANLLKEQLLLEDVSEVSFLATADWQDSADILVRGNLLCNGYAEIYYQADVECLSPNDSICTLSEKPAHGDRPTNLAIEVVSRLRFELDKLVSRDERRRAIRELHIGD